MKRYLEPVDVMVAVGLLATVLGGALLFMSTEGALRAAVPEPASAARTFGVMDAMEWVQPALGQAILEDSLLERNLAQNAMGVVTELNHATVADHRLQNQPLGYLDRVRMDAARIQADHAARVQFVMGRTIVSFTARGVRYGLISGDRPSSDFNRRAITIAEDIGDRMDEEFSGGWQSRLGAMIVSASLTHVRTMAQSQQRIGWAIVRLATLQDQYLAAKEATQEQLASVAVASIHAEQIMDRFERLAAADSLVREEPLPLAAPKSWPEVPYGYLFAASAALVGIFFVGLFLPGIRPESREAARDREAAAGETVYRKTA